MKCSSLLPMLVALLWPGAATAASCCAGAATSIVPTRLDSCESALAGISLGGEASFGRWDAHRMPRSSTLQERAAVATAALAWRWDDKGQVDLSLPVRITHRSAGEAERLGGGPGDLVGTLRWDLRGDPAEIDGPVPVITVGGRLPTGRSWDRSNDPLLADVTGLPGAGGILGLSVERFTGAVPYAFGASSELWISPQGVVPTLRITGALGRSLGTGTVALLTLRHDETRAQAASSPGAGSRTALGARVVHARQNTHRLWVGAEVDVPLPGLGADRLTSASISGGFALVR